MKDERVIFLNLVSDSEKQRKTMVNGRMKHKRRRKMTEGRKDECKERSKNK